MHRRHALVAAAALLTSILGFAPPTAAQQQAGTARSTAAAEVLAAERALWEKMKANEWAAFDNELGQLTYVDGGGITMWKTGNLKQYENITLRSYSLDSIVPRAISSDLVVLTYKATLDQTVNGRSAPSPVYVMSIWSRQGGKWTIVAHSETLVNANPPSSG